MAKKQTAANNKASASGSFWDNLAESAGKSVGDGFGNLLGAAGKMVLGKVSEGLSKPAHPKATAVKSEVPVKRTAPAVASDKPATTTAEQRNGLPDFTSYEVWKEIGCSPRTMKYVRMALADGFIDSQERRMLDKCVFEDNVDLAEFDFYLTKALEQRQMHLQDAVNKLSALFRNADAMAKNEVPRQESELKAALAGLSAICPVAGAVGALVGAFVKTPSKLNELKAEIIRIIEIPMLPSVLVEFFQYASSQIKQERKKAADKGGIAFITEFISGKELDLVPVWHTKMSSVMTRAVGKFARDEEVIRLLSPYRVPPLASLQKRCDNRDYIVSFITPKIPVEFIDVLCYVYAKTLEPECPNKAAFEFLYRKLQTEGRDIFADEPKVLKALANYRRNPLDELKAHFREADYLATFNAPADFDEYMQVLQFVSAHSELKPFHKRIHAEGIGLFGDDAAKLKRIQAFKPKNILGF